MVRSRLAFLALASSLGLVSGCMNMPQMPLLSRFHATPVCCESGCCGDTGCSVGCPVGCAGGCCGAPGEGPLLEGGPVGPPLPPSPPPYAPAPVPAVAAPYPSAPPRLVPAPQSAPMPYVPDVH